MDDATAAFIAAAVGPGPLDRAEELRPGVAANDLYAAAILGDDDAVRRLLAADAGGAARPGGPRGWDALTYLCFSRYLALDASKSAGFVAAATALLDAGASARTESALYGAAGVAHHAGLTRLLVERGADANDGEVAYHTPETHDNAALVVLVNSGKLSADSLATMLLRKADWHDLAGMRILLAAGADPNRMTPWGYTALHQALRRDNALAAVELLLEHGADPALPERVDGRSATALAARRGRGDVLRVLDNIGARDARAEPLIAACALGDGAAARAAAPAQVAELVADGGALLAAFASTGNAEGLRLLLDLGVPVDAPSAGDPYFDVAPGSTALHVAAWRGWPAAVRLLLERGGAADAVDGKGRTPLALAVGAAVDSYWTGRRSPESVRALLAAGAALRGVRFPCGYAEVDALLAAHGAPLA